MAHRVNIMLDEDAREILQGIEKGARSRFVNTAVKREALYKQRRRALEELDALRKGLDHPPGTTGEWIREERDNHR